MKLSEDEKKFCKDLMMKESSVVQVGARVALQDYMIIRKWSDANDYPITWIIKRSFKDFINKYCETGIMPPGEVVNKGCVK